MRKILISFFISFFVFFLFGSTSFAQSQRDFAEDEIIVKLKSNLSQSKLEELNQKLGAKIGKKLLLPQTFTLKVPKSQVQQLVKIYEANPLIEYAELNYKLYALETPNDPFFSNQWGMTKIQAPQAWDISHGSQSAKIAIVDSGIDTDHEDLASKTIIWIDFTGSSPDDLFGHGTHVAGIAAAATNNSIGVAGLGYNASLMSVKVLDDKGSGYISWVADGIKWSADNGARVINLSLGTPFSSTTLRSAVDYAWGKGAVLACAAGNSGNTSPTYPAYYTNCIATAATDQNDQKPSWSSYGSWVDVAAPGVSIFSTFPNHPYNIGPTLSYGYGSGTSMATPHVAGLAGLIFGYNAALSASQVRSTIETYADYIPGTGAYWSKGRINAYRALSSLILSPTPTPTPTLTPSPTPSPSPTPGPSGACWNGDYKYLYKNNNQARKFCKCAQGTYGYRSYTYSFLRSTVYQYTNSSDNEDWNVSSRSSYQPVASVTCLDGAAYPASQTYFRPGGF